jgi:hypothetical protein
VKRWRWILAVSLPSAFAVIGYFVNIIGPISLLLVVLGLCALVVISVTLVLMLALRAAKFRKRPVSAAALQIPAFAVLCGALGLAAGLFGGPAALPSAKTSVSRELTYIYNTDQGDRFTLRWLRPERDAVRLSRVLELHKQGLITNPVDQLNATMVLQHGNDSTHYRLAHELAKAALDGWVATPGRSKEEAEWLMKATYDRWMLSIGKPQVYGTQKEFHTRF